MQGRKQQRPTHPSHTTARLHLAAEPVSCYCCWGAAWARVKQRELPWTRSVTSGLHQQPVAPSWPQCSANTTLTQPSIIGILHFQELGHDDTAIFFATFQCKHLDEHKSKCDISYMKEWPHNPNPNPKIHVRNFLLNYHLTVALYGFKCQATPNRKFKK